MSIVAKKSSVDDEDLDDIDTYDDYEDIEGEENILDGIDARRRLENVLEDKALERMIYGDFYDSDFDRDIDRYNYD